jgi:hypothetical protein
MPLVDGKEIFIPGKYVRTGLPPLLASLLPCNEAFKCSPNSFRADSNLSITV